MDELETSTEVIKVKIIDLRAQLDTEIKRENKTKTGKGPENCHLSSWSFWNLL